MKKGFTLTELLAVIAIISVLALVTVPIVISYTEHAKYSAYENGVKSVFDTAKIYITSYEENGDLPMGGIKVEELKEELKNFNYISGSIYRNSEGSIYVENVSDGTYCASGTKSDLKIVKGDCDNLDSTPPSLKIATNNITSNSVTIVATAIDNQSGVFGYSYSTDGVNYTEISNETIYEIKNLNANQTINIYVRAYNNKYDSTVNESSPNYEEMIKSTVAEKKINVTTLEIEKPIFKISSPSTGEATVKILDIIYPKNIENYRYTYSINNAEEINVDGENVRLNISENSKITANIYYGNKMISNKININGIDNEGPIFVVNYDTKWQTYKDIKIKIISETGELPEKPFSFDGGLTWDAPDGNKKNQKTYTIRTNQILKNKILVRDKRGNITNKFSVNGGGLTDEIIIDSIDNKPPHCEIEVIGTKVNGWYIDDITARVVNVYDMVIDCSSGICKEVQGGSGIKKTNISTKINGKTISGNTSIQIQTNATGIVVTGKVTDNQNNVGTCQLKDSDSIKIDKIIPAISSIKNPLTLGTEDYEFSNNIKIDRKGLSSGTLTCNPKSSKKTGIYNVTCTYVGGNGHSATTTFEVRHSYPATIYDAKKTITKTNCGDRCVDGGPCCPGASASDRCNCNMQTGQCWPLATCCYKSQYKCDETTTYSCNSGDVRSGTKCYSCPSGGRLDGTICRY